MEISNVKLNIDQKSNSETTKPISQDRIVHRQAGDVNEKNVEAAPPPPNVMTSAPSDASQPHEVVILFVILLFFVFRLVSFHANRTLQKVQQGTTPGTTNTN